MNDDYHSLSEKVFVRLEEAILSGRYKRDVTLKENALAEEFGVSRTPVREALRQLELEGLVSMIPNKGAKVVGFTPDDIRDLYEIRSILEGMCAEKAAVYATPEQIDLLEETVYLTGFHAEKGHAKQVFEMDNKFHETLYEACHSKMLANMLRTCHHYVQAVRKNTLKSQERSVKSTEEHAAIAAAIREHDGKKAGELAVSHIMSSIRNIDRCGWENMIRSETDEEGPTDGKN